MDDLTAVPSGPRKPRRGNFLLVLGIGTGIVCGFALVSGSGAAVRFFAEVFGVAGQSLADTLSVQGDWRLAAEVDTRTPHGGASSAPTGKAAPRRLSSDPREKGEKKEQLPALKIKKPPQEVSSAEGARAIDEPPVPAPGLSAAPAFNEEKGPAAAAPATAFFGQALGDSQPCAFGTAVAPSRRALINEVAWMGSPPRANESASAASSNEWIEIKNMSGANSVFPGWQIMNESRDLYLVLDNAPSSSTFFLLERTDEDSVPGITSNGIYTGSLSNSGEWLKLFDDACALADELDARGGWPGGDNATKQTLERNRGDLDWHTSASAGGTPRAENSTPPPPPLLDTALKHQLSVSVRGGGLGEVISVPAGIRCGSECAREYEAGTTVVLTATGLTGSVFENWGGACSGEESCHVTVSDALSVVAYFRLGAESQAGDENGGSSSGAGSEPPLVIAEAQIAGEETANDFIRIHNPTGSNVDISGWKLRKRTSSGGEYSVRVFPQGSAIAAGGYFTWANSGNGFDLALGANVASTQTLAADNSLALIDPSDVVVDAVAWGSGHTNPFGEGLPYPANPEADQKVARRNLGGALQDTNDNSADFEIR